MEIKGLNLLEIVEGLKSGKFSSHDLTKACLKNIEENDQDILAFLKVASKRAFQEAEKADQLIAEKKSFSLTGIPLAVKDNILVKDISCTAGSKILENYIAPYDATVVRRLKAQQAVILGKTNLDEFAMGSSTENSAFQITHNPYDLTRVPGGSSGGSAAAVKSGEAVYSLGSDTGGSVRQPAAFCGVVGLKPTYGSVSRYGLIAFASSLDQIGPITKTVAGSRLVFQAIRGKDLRDATSQDSKAEEWSKGKFRIGVLHEALLESADPKIIQRIREVTKMLEAEGHEVEIIELPHLLYALPAYYIIAPAEASANLARYDGIKYGVSVQAQSLQEVYRETRGRMFGSEVKRRIMLGTFVLSAGYAEAYYQRAWKVRKLIMKDFEKAFSQVDVIISPTTPSLPFKIGEKTKDPVQMYLSDLFTAPANIAGLPALTVPVGEIEGLPVGLQIMAPHFCEERLFQLGEKIEKLIKV